MENYTDAYSTAVRSIQAGIKALGPQTEQTNPPIWFLAHGLLRMAQGLLEESQKTDIRLADLARRLPPA